MTGKRTNLIKGTWIPAVRGAIYNTDLSGGRGGRADTRETEVHPYYDGVVLDLGTSEA